MQTTGAPPPGYELSGMIEEVLVNNTGDFRTFAGQDLGIGRITDGNYQYYVEVQIKDGTQEFLENKLKELQMAIYRSQQYHSRASFALNYDSFTKKFRDSFIAAEYDRRRYAILDATSFSNVAAALESRKGPLSVQEWFGAIIKYVEVLDLVSNIEAGKKSALVKALYSLVNPITGTLDSIGKFISLLSDLENKVKRLLSRDSRAHTEERSAMGTGGRYPFFKVSWEFNSVFDSNIMKDTGLDYFGTGNSSGGLLKISRKDYIARINKEYARIAHDLLTPNQVKRDYSFLTPENTRALFSDVTQGADIAPAYIDLLGKRVDLLSQNVDSLDYVSVTSILQSILTIDSLSGVSGELSDNTLGILDKAGKGPTAERMSDIARVQRGVLATLGLTVPPLDQTVNTTPGKSGACVSAEAYLGRGSPFITLVPPEETLTIKLVEDNPEQATSVLNRVLEVLNISPTPGRPQELSPLSDISFDLAKPNNYITKNVIPSRQGASLKTSQKQINKFIRNSIPHQQKLLTLRKGRLYNDTAAKTASDDDVKADGFMYNFGALRRVEYLSGFKGGFIKSEVWKKLTFQDLSMIKGPLLCRIKQNTESILNIGDYESLNSLPIYNEYFIITGPTADLEPVPLDLGVNLNENIKTLFNGMEEKSVRQLLELVSLRHDSPEEIQYTMTQVPQPPTNAFNIISGLQTRAMTTSRKPKRPRRTSGQGKGSY